MSSYYSSSPRSVSSVLSIEFRQVGRLRRVAMSGCQRCLECGCLAVSDVLCADVWLSAMSCVRMLSNLLGMILLLGTHVEKGLLIYV